MALWQQILGAFLGAFLGARCPSYAEEQGLCFLRASCLASQKPVSSPGRSALTCTSLLMKRPGSPYLGLVSESPGLGSLRSLILTRTVLPTLHPPPQGSPRLGIHTQALPLRTQDGLSGGCPFSREPGADQPQTQHHLSLPIAAVTEAERSQKQSLPGRQTWVSVPPVAELPQSQTPQWETGIRQTFQQGHHRVKPEMLSGY